MDPKTKREAEEMLRTHDQRARSIEESDSPTLKEHDRAYWIRHHEAEAARLRALLPTLPS